MITKLIGGILCLCGVALMGGCFYVAYISQSPGWGLGGFIAGMSVIGTGASMAGVGSVTAVFDGDDDDNEYVD